MNGYLSKPINARELIELVERTTASRSCTVSTRRIVPVSLLPTARQSRNRARDTRGGALAVAAA
jgi:hypothetical protein